ncbi:MAG: GT2 family glycosyltransferase [Candidatus Azotimanducaceae bacterium]
MNKLSTLKHRIRRLARFGIIFFAIPDVIRFRNGLVSGCLFYYGFIRDSGLRSAGGRLVSDSAFVLRKSSVLYRYWLKNEVVLQARLEVPLEVVADIRDWSAVEVEKFSDYLSDVKWVAAQTLIETDEAALNFYTSTCLEIQSNPKKIVLFTKYPCLFHQNMEAVAQNFFETDFDVLVFDHDEMIDGVRCKASFHPGVDKELFVQEKYNACLLLNAAFFRGDAKEFGPNNLGASFLNKAITPHHRPLVLVHFLRGPPIWCGEPLHNREAYDQVTSRLTSIIIPTRDRLDLLKECVESIERKNPNGNYEIIIVDNGSRERETLDWLLEREKLDRQVVVRCDEPFNWSRLNNYGAAHAKGECLIFLNNDTRSIDEGWISKMEMAVRQNDIGCVGPMLLYPDGTIQHAGLVVGFGGGADHIYSGFDPADCLDSPFVTPNVTRSVTCNTGACLAVEASRFFELGGFDEEFAIAGDLKLCVNFMSHGYRNIYLASVRLVHFESASRNRGFSDGERRSIAALIEANFAGGDPYFSNNLSTDSLYPMVRWY